MTATKPILQQFVVWPEAAYGHPVGGAASEFAVQPPPETLAFAAMALEAALKGDRPVVLGTTVPVRSVIAALVLKRAGIELDHIFRGVLNETQFTKLAEVLLAVKKSKLLIEPPME